MGIGDGIDPHFTFQTEHGKVGIHIAECRSFVSSNGVRKLAVTARHRVVRVLEPDIVQLCDHWRVVVHGDVELTDGWVSVVVQYVVIDGEGLAVFVQT